MKISYFSKHIAILTILLMCAGVFTVYAEDDTSVGTELVSYTPTAEEMAALEKERTIATLKSKIDSQNSQIKNIQKEIEEVKAKIGTTQGQKDSLKKALSTLELNKSLVEKDLLLTQSKIAIANDVISTLNIEINSARYQINRSKEALAKSFRSIYQGEYTNGDGLVKALSADSLSDVVDLASKYTHFQEAVIFNVNKITDEKKKLEDTQETSALERNNLIYLNLDLKDRKKVIEETKKEKANLLTITKNQEVAYQKQLADRKALMAKLEAEINAYEEQLRIEIDPNTLPTTGTGILKFPVAKHIITQYFGKTAFATKNAQVYNGQGHNGIDFGISVGTPIQASLSGTIMGTGNTDSACPGSSYGKWVLIKHDNGLATLYAHLSVIRVSSGQSVTTGQVIGLSGNTGYSTGPHLHFTVYASKAVSIITRASKACGTMMTLPVSPQNGYLNPLSYL